MAAPLPSVAEMLSACSELPSFIVTCDAFSGIDESTPDLPRQLEGHSAALCVGLAAHRSSEAAQAAGLRALATIYTRSSEEPPSGAYDTIAAAMRAHTKSLEVQEVGVQVKIQGGSE